MPEPGSLYHVQPCFCLPCRAMRAQNAPNRKSKAVKPSEVKAADVAVSGSGKKPTRRRNVTKNPTSPKRPVGRPRKKPLGT